MCVFGEAEAEKDPVAQESEKRVKRFPSSESPSGEVLASGDPMELRIVGDRHVRIDGEAQRCETDLSSSELCRLCEWWATDRSHSLKTIFKFSYRGSRKGSPRKTKKVAPLLREEGRDVSFTTVHRTLRKTKDHDRCLEIFDFSEINLPVVDSVSYDSLEGG